MSALFNDIRSNRAAELECFLVNAIRVRFMTRTRILYFLCETFLVKLTKHQCWLMKTTWRIVSALFRLIWRPERTTEAAYSCESVWHMPQESFSELKEIVLKVSILQAWSRYWSSEVCQGKLLIWVAWRLRKMIKESRNAYLWGEGLPDVLRGLLLNGLDEDFE